MKGFHSRTSINILISALFGDLGCVSALHAHLIDYALIIYGFTKCMLVLGFYFQFLVYVSTQACNVVHISCNPIPNFV